MCCHGRRTMKTIRYKSKNGYNGMLYGRELKITDSEGHTKFHTYASNCKTQKDLKQFVDDFPELLELFSGIVEEYERGDGDGIQ